MALRKQEFYEGAALYQLARCGTRTSFLHDPPFFVVNDQFLIYLKYSTKGRTPWGFSFSPEEQGLLQKRARDRKLFIGLICGGDGIAAISYDNYAMIAKGRASSVYLSCARKHDHHYTIAGPDGELGRTIPPSFWQRLLERRGTHEAS